MRVARAGRANGEGVAFPARSAILTEEEAPRQTTSVGLLTGKKAYVVATRGGRYAGTPQDFETGYVRQFLGFLGITDVEFAYAEGLAISDASREASLAGAARSIAQLTSVERLAA